MKQRLVDILACPDCLSHNLLLVIKKYGHGDLEIEEGSLDCPNCSRTFLIKDGIPRMLPHDFQGNQENIVETDNKGTLLTIIGYDFHHLRKGDNNSKEKYKITDPSELELTRQYFINYLALNASDVETLKGRLVLDAGCGAGRFMAVAQEYDVLDIVGLDLSEGGLLRARSLLEQRQGFHLIQGDITRPPFRPEIFDIIYSIGVLHHLKDPEEGFHAIESLIAKGGQVWVWVYGLESMSPIYRLSHLKVLRHFTKSWPLQRKFRLCQKLAVAFRFFYLFPMVFAKKVLPNSIFKLLPYTERTSFSYNDLVYAFFDRLQPPYTHYLKKAQLEQFSASLKEVSISNPHQRGWIVKGKKF